MSETSARLGGSGGDGKTDREVMKCAANPACAAPPASRAPRRGHRRHRSEGARRHVEAAGRRGAARWPTPPWGLARLGMDKLSSFSLFRGSAPGEDGRAASPCGRSKPHNSNPTDARDTGGGRYFIYRPPPDGKRNQVHPRARAGRRHRWRPRCADLHGSTAGVRSFRAGHGGPRSR